MELILKIFHLYNLLQHHLIFLYEFNYLKGEGQLPVSKLLALQVAEIIDQARAFPGISK